MFKRLYKNPEKPVSITINGKVFKAFPGETVAAAVLASGISRTRSTPVSASPRGPFCLMGVCYECLMKINGLPNQRACRAYVTEGMKIEYQQGAGVPEE